MAGTADASPTLSEALGRGTARLRQAAGRTQDDIARAASAYGLTWAQTSVANLEAGKRTLTLADGVLLPEILRTALGRDVTIADLLEAADAGEVMVGALLVPASFLRGMLEHHVDADRVAEQPDLLERRLAARLGVPPVIVRAFASETFGHSMTEERDRRTEAAAPGVDNEASRRAVRGHVTKQLTLEVEPLIREMLEEAKDDRGAR